MRLSGPQAPRAMERLCALDLRTDKFSAEDIAQTRVGHIEAVMVRSHAGFDVLFDVTASAYFARTVAAAARHCTDLLIDTEGHTMTRPARNHRTDPDAVRRRRPHRTRPLGIPRQMGAGPGSAFPVAVRHHGEALSVSLRERMQALRVLVEAGIRPAG